MEGGNVNLTNIILGRYMLKGNKGKNLYRLFLYFNCFFKEVYDV